VQLVERRGTKKWYEKSSDGTKSLECESPGHKKSTRGTKSPQYESPLTESSNAAALQTVLLPHICKFNMSNCGPQVAKIVHIPWVLRATNVKRMTKAC